MPARRPNFFFIGAPKCGTTSIAQRLAAHPAVFISDPKEPGFFATDLPRGIRSLRRYEALFGRATDCHAIVGEASTSYLYSMVAVPSILQYAPDARFLAAVRSPFEMAISLHGHALKGGYEDVPDFATAWQLQEQRARGNHIPRRCLNPRMLLYAQRCAIGEQLTRASGLIPPDRLLVVFMDDLRANPATLYQNIYSFLGIPDDAAPDFPVANVRGGVRSQTLARAVRRLGRVKRALGFARSIGFADVIARANAGEAPGAEPAAETWGAMATVFMKQIDALERLTGRNLDAWRRPPGEVARP